MFLRVKAMNTESFKNILQVTISADLHPAEAQHSARGLLLNFRTVLFVAYVNRYCLCESSTKHMSLFKILIRSK